jgi:hypothetical protein
MPSGLTAPGHVSPPLLVPIKGLTNPAGLATAAAGAAWTTGTTTLIPKVTPAVNHLRSRFEEDVAAGIAGAASPLIAFAVQP